MNTGGMQSCPRCGGAVFQPGVAVGWGGPVCHCGTMYDLRNGPQVPTQGGQQTPIPYDPSWVILKVLERIERKLDSLKPHPKESAK